MSNEMSPADMMAMLNNGNANWNNNPFLWLIFLAMIGNGGFGMGGNAAAAAGSTKAELVEGLNNQTVLNDLRSAEVEISNVEKAVQNTENAISQQLHNGFTNSNLTMTNGFSGLGMSGLQNTSTITSAINQAAAAQQLANCNLSHEIQRNSCEITNAIHQEGELTRGLITTNTIQELREKLAAKDNELQSAHLSISNNLQTKSILDSLGRFVPYSTANAW
jgi:hypothetical protein